MARAEQNVDQVKDAEQLFVAADGVHGGSWTDDGEGCV
jgi:hypothetical protein